MKRSCIGLAMGALLMVAVLLSFPSCGFKRRLVLIVVQPSAFTFGTPDKTVHVQYTATGTYVHPPESRNITNQVTWNADFAQLITFSASTPGQVSPEGSYCGTANISATAPESTDSASNIVTGYATVTVNDPSSSLCPGGGTLASLAVGVVGNGTVTSVPGGIACPATSCVSTFNVGSSVLLTATPGQGATTTTWVGCTSSGNVCTVAIPTGGAAVIATFN